MDCKVVSLLQASFNELWKCKKRGDTLEVVVPYISTFNEFVSVYITERNGDYIVSDGSFLDQRREERQASDKEKRIQKNVLEHYQKTFLVQETSKPGEPKYFYKKVRDIGALPGAVFEISQFIAAISSTLNIELPATKEDRIFHEQAKSFLQAQFGERVSFKKSLVHNTRKIAVNVKIVNKQNKIDVIQYVTGSSEAYFQSSIAKTDVLFQILSSWQDEPLNQKIALVNDSAGGYRPDDSLQKSMNEILGTHANEIVPWSQHERLPELVHI